MKKFRLLGLLLIILCTLFLSTRCSVRSLVYIPPVPRNQTSYLENYALWEDSRRSFKVDGATLSGWYVEKKNCPLLVYYGGNSMDIATLLPYLTQFPCACLLVNYRGYGLSTGNPTEKHLVNDAIQILDQIVKESNRSLSQVILVGQSLGSGVATQVAAQREVGKLNLIVPFDSLLATAEDLFPYLPVSWILPDHFRSDLHAPNVKCPVSIIAAGNDEVIHPSHARKLSKCFTTPVEYTEIPQALHNSFWNFPEFHQAFKKSLHLPTTQPK